MKWLGIAAALALAACGSDGSESTAAAGSHDVFEGVWLVTSAAGKPSQEFRFFRAYDGTVRAGGWVFYPADQISYVGAENLSLDGSVVTGNALITVTFDHALIVPLSVTFHSATRLTGMLGSLQLEGSR